MIGICASCFRSFWWQTCLNDCHDVFGEFYKYFDVISWIQHFDNSIVPLIYSAKLLFTWSRHTKQRVATVIMIFIYEEQYYVVNIYFYYFSANKDGYTPRWSVHYWWFIFGQMAVHIYVWKYRHTNGSIRNNNTPIHPISNNDTINTPIRHNNTPIHPISNCDTINTPIRKCILYIASSVVYLFYLYILLYSVYCIL